MHAPSSSANLTACLFLLASIILSGSPSALAGEISFAYDQDGTEPGTVWVTVMLDPLDWGPCDECLLPDWSEIHVSPPPLQPDPWTGSSYPGGSRIDYDETGAWIRGDFYGRTLVLDVGTTYEITGALTQRAGLEVVVLIDGTRECQSQVGCLYEVDDYPDLTIDPMAVEVGEGSLSVLKTRYRE